MAALLILGLVSREQVQGWWKFSPAKRLFLLAPAESWIDVLSQWPFCHFYTNLPRYTYLQIQNVSPWWPNNQKKRQCNLYRLETLGVVAVKVLPFVPCQYYLLNMGRATISLLVCNKHLIKVTYSYYSEKAMATHSSTLAWKIPWMEEPGRLPSMGSLRVGHDWVTSLSLFTFMHWRRKWQPTPVFLPRESQGWGSLVGCRLWGHTESDMTEAT